MSKKFQKLLAATIVSTSFVSMIPTNVLATPNASILEIPATLQETEDPNVLTFTTNEKSIRIINNLISRESLNEQEVLGAIEAALATFDSEIDSSNEDYGIFDYHLIVDDKMYFYEETDASTKEALMVVYNIDLEDVSPEEITEEVVDSENRAAHKEIEMGDGYGGRVAINQTGNKYLNFQVNLPSSLKLPKDVSSSNKAVTPYIYGGFVGGKSASDSKRYATDMGLQYSPTYKVWKPTMLVDISGQKIKGSLVAPNNQVQNVNGYLPGTPVTVTIHPNNDQSLGLVGSIRLKLDGKAKYGDMAGSSGSKNLTSIMDLSGKTPRITSVDSYKVLLTYAHDDESNDAATPTNIASCKASFSNVNIGGTVVPTSKMSLEAEHATFPSASNGSFTIDLNK